MDKALQQYIKEQELKKLFETLQNEIPARVTEAADETARRRDNLIFFSLRAKRGAPYVGYCCSCRKPVTLTAVRHQQFIECPHCGRGCHAIQLGRRKQNYTQTFWRSDLLIYLQNLNGLLMFRAFEINWVVDEKNYTNYPIKYRERKRVIIDGKKATAYANDSYYDYRRGKMMPAGWQALKSVGGYNHASILINTRQDFAAAIAGTHYEKGPLLDFAYNRPVVNNYGVEVIGFAMKLLTTPCIEYLHKFGYAELVNEIIQGRSKADQTLNLRARGVRGVFGMEPAQVKAFVTPETTEKDIKNYKLILNLCPNPDVEISRKFVQEYSLERKCALFNLVHINRLGAYVQKQLELRGGERCGCHAGGYGGTTFALVLGDYEDYISECRKLDYDLTDEGVLFPRDLHAAHERTSQIIRQKKNELTAAAYLKAVTPYALWQYSRAGLLVRVAATFDELVNEGKKLSHCVGIYADRVISGSCVIFFVRKASEPDAPYFTFEYGVKDKRIVQLRGLRNCSAPPEVTQLANDWLKHTAVFKRTKPEQAQQLAATG